MKLAMHTFRFSGVAVLLWLLICGATAFSQGNPAVTLSWRTSEANMSGAMMDTDASDNVFTLSYTVVGDYIVTKKFNRSGTLLWRQVFDPAERLTGTWLSADPAGNLFVTATIVSGSNYDPAGFYTLKYDPNGNLLWADKLSGGYMKAVRIEADGSGNAYHLSRMWLTNSSGNTTHDFAVIKYAANGTRLWIRSFTTDPYSVDEPSALAISADDSKIAAVGKGGQSFLALMYDAGGNLLWRSYQSATGPANDVAFGFNNDVYVGAHQWTQAASNQMAIFKFSASSGAQLWARTYSVGDFVYRLGVDVFGNVAATGVDQTSGSLPYLDWITIKTDSNGNLLWSQRYDGSRNNDERPNLMALDPGGNVYVTGGGGPSPGGGLISTLYGATVKYNADGTKAWAITDHPGISIRLGVDNSVYVFNSGVTQLSRYVQTGLPDVVPNAPTGLSASSFFTGVKYVGKLAWTDNSSNEFWFEIERCAGVNCTNFAKVGQTYGQDSTGFEDSTAVPATTYTYRVRALGFMGGSDYTNTVVVTILGDPPPAAPTNLTAVQEGSYVRLNWTDNASNETGFTVYRCDGANCTAWYSYWGTGANVTTYLDLGAYAGRTYSYRVNAYNNSGSSDYTNVATVTVKLVTPPAPTNLTAEAQAATQMRLAWDDNGNNEDGFKLERCTGAGCTSFRQIGTAAANQNYYFDYTVRANTTYVYRVRAYNSVGNSPYSNTATAKTPK
ncbi:MAG: hypothetical protein U0Z53_11130 [Blastocatellia bacterium]